MKKFLLIIVLVNFLPLTSYLSPLYAQCGIENTAFKSGEFLGYDLYFNWKFVWVKVGTASMSTVKSRYQGQPAYRSSLITRGNDKLDNVFVMRDTLLCYTDMDLAPLYFRKGAREGSRYYVDELWYSYPKGNCHLKTHAITSSGEHLWKEMGYKDCIYWLKFGGYTTIKMKNSNDKYRCLVFSFIEREDGENHELIRFYVTDDKNHLPVRLDMFLSFGSAKAYLTGFKGLRNPMESKID